jgi:hypothetical protein
VAANTASIAAVQVSAVGVSLLMQGSMIINRSEANQQLQSLAAAHSLKVFKAISGTDEYFYILR